MNKQIPFDDKVKNYLKSKNKFDKTLQEIDNDKELQNERHKTRMQNEKRAQQDAIIRQKETERREAIKEEQRKKHNEFTDALNKCLNQDTDKLESYIESSDLFFRYFAQQSGLNNCDMTYFNAAIRAQNQSLRSMITLEKLTTPKSLKTLQRRDKNRNFEKAD